MGPSGEIVRFGTVRGAGGRRGRGPGCPCRAHGRAIADTHRPRGGAAGCVRVECAERPGCAQLVARLDIFDDDVTLRNILAPIGMRCVGLVSRLVSLSVKNGSSTEGALPGILRIEIRVVRGHRSRARRRSSTSTGLTRDCRASQTLTGPRGPRTNQNQLNTRQRPAGPTPGPVR